MNRRRFLTFLLGSAAIITAERTLAMSWFETNKNNNRSYPVSHSEHEWQEKLTGEEFRVLRKHGTEPPGSSPLNNEKRQGTYVCAGCGNALYASQHKFDSGTGWPSFYQAVSEKAVETTTDYKLIYPRTEVHCSNCGGHLGHIFDDGPPPTGKRHCINGVAMDFQPIE